MHVATIGPLVNLWAISLRCGRGGQMEHKSCYCYAITISAHGYCTAVVSMS